MIFHFFNGNSVYDRYSEAFIDEFIQFIRYGLHDEGRWQYNTFFKLLLSLDPRQRRPSTDKLINESSEGPNVCLWSIFFFEYGFWAHVNRTTQTNIMNLPFCLHCKSKISYLTNTIISYKYICNFEISMDNLLLG